MERGFKTFLNFLVQPFLSEEHAKKKGLLQGLDARVKVTTLFILLIMATFLKSPWLLAGLSLICVLLAWFSKIGPFFFLRRVWFFIPLFAGIVALPALFLVPGETLWAMEGLRVSISYQGLHSAILLVLRVGTTVSLLNLLILTTRWPVLLKAMGDVKVLQPFVFVLATTLRYIHLLVGLVEKMHLALMSRDLGAQGALGLGHWSAGRMSTLLSKSLRLSEEVYLAMLSRAYSGQVKSAETFHLRPLDYGWTASCLVAVVAFFVLDHFVINAHLS